MSSLSKAAESTSYPVGVLLLHGLTGTPTEMKPVYKYLSKRGYYVKSPMLAGHGQTHKELLRTTWEDWLAGTQEALDELSRSCEEVYIVGLSLGCLLSILLAVNNPHINGICLLSMDMGIPSKGVTPLRVLLPLVRPIPVLRNYLYWVENPPYGLKDERLQRRITLAIEAARKRESSEYGLFRTYISSFHQMHRLIKTVKKKAGQVTCPVEIVHSTEDTMLSPENALLIHRLLGSAQKSLKFIDGCDHVMTVDLQKETVARLTYEFIEQTRTNASRSEKKFNV